MNQAKEIALRSCGLFNGISECASLLGCLHGEEVHFRKNDVIWQVDAPVRSCAVILSGAVRAEAVNALGQHTLMAYHQAGALVGDVLMATPGGTSPVYVIAAEDSDVLFLPFSGIMGGCARCCSAHAKLRENLISEIAQKFWAQRRRIAYLSTPSLRARVAMYLLDRNAESFHLGMTRENLADFLCVNRSALSRELGRMKREGLIDFERDAFRIRNSEALARML